METERDEEMKSVLRACALLLGALMGNILAMLVANRLTGRPRR